jgi:tetratricopeptide (TPR) repeat protein/DNA-binding winged helix-turn-helix (wHTH) protein
VGTTLNSELLQGFWLDNYLVEPLKGQVTSESGTKHLPPKAVEVLLYLAKAPGSLVTHDVLLREVWGSGKGSQQALSHAVSEIRQAFDDHYEDPRIIRTVPRRGYCLLLEPILDNGLRDAGGQASQGERAWWDRLLRHGVVQAAAAYLVAGWLLIQVADTTFAKIGLPGWSESFVTFVVIGGFPLVLLLAWFFEFVGGRLEHDKGGQSGTLLQGLERNYLAIFIAYGISTIGAGVYQAAVGFDTSETPGTKRSEDIAAVLGPIEDNTIAVLPFLNVDGSEQTQVFANGLVDDVINRLARVPGLRVSSRGDSSTLNPNSASQQVRRRLRVAMYIEGSVEISSDTIRVIVQLIDSADGFHIQSRTFDRTLDDYFRLRDEITQLSVSSMRVALPRATQALSRASTHDPVFDAYVLYRRGVEDLEKPNSVANFESAIGWMNAALEVDPEYAAAHAGKCQAFIGLLRRTSDTNRVTDAERSCGKALELNPNLEIVHTALGGLYAHTGKYAKAESAYLHALEINPESVMALMGLADIYPLQGRPADGEKALTSAVDLEPGNWLPYNALGFFYFSQGRFEEAATQFEKVVAIDNQNMQGFGNLGTSLMMSGELSDAAAAFERSIELEPQPSTYSNLGLLRYYLGEYEAAASALRSAIEIKPLDHLYWSNLGDILWNAGQENESREAFDRAAELADAALQVNPRDPSVMMDRAWIRAMLDDTPGALTDIRSAAEMLTDDPYVDFIAGLILARIGDVDGAITSLEQAVEKGYPRNLLASEPHLSSLRQEQRFSALIKYMKPAHEQ